MSSKASSEPMEVNSDLDSSSDDEEEQRVLATQAAELERQISDNKFLYNAHVELVELYRKLGDLNSMRSAYERFHQYFPLTPEIWLAWINDEKKLATSEETIKQVFALFDKAVEDYLSVNLWLEYIQYSLSASGLDTTRSIIERGLQAAGLHVADGSLLWGVLREVELAHLSLAEKDSEEWKKQLARVGEAFRRQLSVPLLDMEDTFAEWQEWTKTLPEGHGINISAVEWGYKNALKVLETYNSFEDQLQQKTEEADLLHCYREYIKIITDPSTIFCTYERAVAQMCLNTSVWQEYCKYAFKLGDAADKISKRALRNCPWSESLWIERLRILEYLKRSDAEILACFEQGISNMGSGQGTELWLSYLEFNIRAATEKEKIYKLFSQAQEQLKFKDQSGFCRIAKLHARIVAKNGNMPDARRMWKEILKIPDNRQSVSIWLEFANLERQYGEIGQVRSIFQRALSSCSDWPQYIAEEWLMFERELGSLEDVIKCTEKCQQIVKIEPVQQSPQENKKRKIQYDEEPIREVTKKTKLERLLQATKKTPIVKDPKTTVFISNLYPSIDEKRLERVFPNAVNIELVLDKFGKSRCYGYVQFSMEEEVMTALARDRELLSGRPLFISNCKPDRTERKSVFKYSSEIEENKLFIRGLPLSKTEEDIEAIFKPLGSISVRLVRQKSGQPKGLAYVEFEDSRSAKNALEKTDQMKIGDHTITVSISAPPSKSKPNVLPRPKAAEPLRHARSKLQMAPMVPRSVQLKSGEEKNGNEKKVAAKSNEDFRKMLLDK